MKPLWDGRLGKQLGELTREVQGRGCTGLDSCVPGALGRHSEDWGNGEGSDIPAGAVHHLDSLSWHMCGSWQCMCVLMCTACILGLHELGRETPKLQFVVLHQPRYLLLPSSLP